MIENRNVKIITDADGKKLVLINDIRFKAKARDDWKAIEAYLKEYIGEFYETQETSEKIYISADFPDEYASSESRIALKGAVAKTKANAAQAVPELIKYVDLYPFLAGVTTNPMMIGKLKRTDYFQVLKELCQAIGNRKLSPFVRKESIPVALCAVLPFKALWLWKQGRIMWHHSISIC